MPTRALHPMLALCLFFGCTKQGRGPEMVGTGERAETVNTQTTEPTDASSNGVLEKADGLSFELSTDDENVSIQNATGGHFVSVGSVYAGGGERVVKLRLVNTSKTEVALVGTKRSCGCTRVEFATQRMVPGGATEIELGIAAGPKGMKRAQVDFQIDADSTGSYRLMLDWDAEAGLEFADERIELVERIREMDVPLLVNDASALPEKLSVRLLPPQAGEVTLNLEKRTVHLTLSETAVDDFGHCQINLFSDESQLVDFMVVAFDRLVSDDFKLLQQLVFFRNVAPGEWTTTRILIDKRETKLDGLAVQLDGPGEARIEEVTGESITIAFRAPIAPDQTTLKGTFYFVLDGEPLVSVPMLCKLK